MHERPKHRDIVTFTLKKKVAVVRCVVMEQQWIKIAECVVPYTFIPHNRQEVRTPGKGEATGILYYRLTPGLL